VADGQGNPAATEGLVDAIAKVTPKPIKYVVICSDHGDHTAGNASFPAGVNYIVHPTSKATLDAAAARGGRTRVPGGCPPMPTSSPNRVLTLGGREIQILFSGARTPAATSVSICRASDPVWRRAYLNRVFPAMRHYPSEWWRC
jgi:glyoxylase-like metal-dependent hydrolase (beta-lactamase superfamily II)